MGAGDSKLTNEEYDSLKLVTDFDQKTLEEISVTFRKLFPTGELTRKEFVRENLKIRGGTEEFWGGVFQFLDRDKDGIIDFKEYLLQISSLTPHSNDTIDDQLSYAFGLYDQEGTGEIDKQAFSSVLRNLKQSRSLASISVDNLSVSATLDEAFETMDLDHNGKVTREEFVKACKTNEKIKSIVQVGLQSVIQPVGAPEEKTIENLGLSTFKEQVAGHGSEKPSRDSMLRDTNEGTIWKPLAQTEFRFYEALDRLANNERVADPALHSSSSESGHLSVHSSSSVPTSHSPSSSSSSSVHVPLSEEQEEELRKRHEQAKKLAGFVSKYHGRNFLNVDGEFWQYIVLENLLDPDIKEPCVIDLKMGTQGHGDDADARKVIQQKALVAATTSGSLGFRICGMRVWQEGKGQYQVRDKKWGAMNVTDTTMEHALLMYLSTGSRVRWDLIDLFLEELKKLLVWFEEQSLFRFYSSSILLIYDGASVPVSEGGELPKIKVKMVDFAHTHRIMDPQERDDSYIFGLKKLISLLEGLEGKFNVERKDHTKDAHQNSDSHEGPNLNLVLKDTGVMHQWSRSQFTTPTFCTLCGKLIWGLLLQGFKCHKCGWACHPRCVEFYPRSCLDDRTEGVPPFSDAHLSHSHHDHDHDHDHEHDQNENQHEDPFMSGITRLDVPTTSKKSREFAEPHASEQKLVKAHNFQRKQYMSPTKCDWCQQYLLGLVLQGFECSDCKVNSHKKCITKWPLECYPPSS